MVKKVVNTIKTCHGFLSRPTMMLWLMTALGLASAGFAGWGLMHVTSLSARVESHDERMLSAAVDLKEQVAVYSKLTYDFLLQQDYSKMMVKEKQSNTTRQGIEQGLAQLVAVDDGNAAAHALVANIRTNVTQFLLLSDKALEAATEDGSATKARSILQDEVEPVFKSTQDSLSRLISSRKQFDVDRFYYMRSQAFMVIAMLVGLTALGAALIMGLRRHILNSHHHQAHPKPQPEKQPDAAETALQAVTAVAREIEEEDAARIEAQSLAKLAFANRLSRVRKESDDLRKLLQGLQAFAAVQQEAQKPLMPRGPASDEDINALVRQGDRISHAVGRIQNIHEQSKQFIDKLSEMMGGMQKLATEGNVVALNVTIELAKLQAQSGEVQEDKNRAVSEQIRTMATTAAAITGKLAMVLSQFRYTQEDFSRHAQELGEVRNMGNDALERVRGLLHTTGQSAARLTGRNEELAGYMPLLEQKMLELENQITQLQSIYAAEIEMTGEGITPRSFKVISGGAA